MNGLCLGTHVLLGFLELGLKLESKLSCVYLFIFLSSRKDLETWVLGAVDTLSCSSILNLYVLV